MENSWQATELIEEIECIIDELSSLPFTQYQLYTLSTQIRAIQTQITIAEELRKSNEYKGIF